MIPIQLDLFKSDEEVRTDSMQREIVFIKETLGKVRRGQYAKLGELAKLIYEMEERLSLIEKNLCRPAT